MNVTVAKTAGFCFGVNRAVDMTTKLAKQGRKVATMGPLIHNTQAVQQLEDMGVITLTGLEVPQGYEVVLRSHGVEKNICKHFADCGITMHDATCPYVKKIHHLAEKTGLAGKTLLVAGDAAHPEVQGIVSYTDGEYFVFNEPQQLEEWLLNPDNQGKKCVMVAQTTYMLKKWAEILNILKNLCTECEIFDTICRATNERQTEAAVLAQQNDLMIVIGGRHSSNTQKLVKVCEEYCRTISIETVKELSPELFINIKNVGVTAGASTPAFIIQEVLNNMSDVIREDGMSFEEMLNESYANQQKVYRGAKIKGVVTSVRSNEITVDIGTKHTGFVKLSELTDDPSAKAEDLVKKGDELNLIVIKPNDREGTVELSKKRYDAMEGQDVLAKAVESGETLTVTIAEAVKGGLVALVNGVRVFIPATLAAARNESLEALVKTKQEIKVLESTRDGGRRKVIGSIRAVKDEKVKELKEKFWETVEEGKKYAGTVKSLTRYGAFVDLGGVDGLVHLSELTWEKIKHPGEILKVGDAIDVFVKSIDKENGKISLGHKLEEDNPWTKLETEYPLGTVFTAKVVSITKFGAFVNILPGIDGLVHISEISYDRVEDPNTVLKVGQEVQVKLIGVDLEAKRVSLSIKQTQEPPVKAEEPAEDAE